MTEFTTSLQPRSPRRASWPVLFVLPAMAASILWALPNGPAEPPAGRAPFAQAPWVRTELYFGMTCPDGSRVSDDDWRVFLDAEVTPRFPEGLTVVRGAGRYRGADQRTHEEPTGIVVLLRPRDPARDDDRRIGEITAAYIRRFRQESVLRCDSPAEAAIISAAPRTSAE